MAETAGRRGGLGFGAGVLTGLLFSAVVLIGLMVSQPVVGPPDAAVPDTPAAALPSTQPDAEPRLPTVTAPAPSRDAAPAVSAERADPDPGPGSAPSASDPPRSELATPSGAVRPDPVRETQGEPPASPEPADTAPAAPETDAAAPVSSDPDVSEAAAEVDVVEGEASPAAAADADTPDEEGTTADSPPPPLWRANATPPVSMAGRTAGVALAPMAVVVTGATPASLPALRAVAPFGPLTLAIDAGQAGATALAAELRALGHEVLLRPALPVPGTDSDPAALADTLADAVARLGVAVGFAAGPVPAGPLRAALLAATSRQGALLLDTVPGSDSALVAAGRAEQLPVAAAALTITATTDATVAFQLLREAGLRAVGDGRIVVVLEASPVTLTALGRWLALPGDAVPAPLTQVVAALGPTAY